MAVGTVTKGPFNALAMIRDGMLYVAEAQQCVAKQEVDIRLAKRKLASLEAYCQQANHQQVIDRLQLTERLKQARLDLDRYESAEYLQSLRGCIGVDPAL